MPCCSRERVEQPAITSVSGLWITGASRQFRTHLWDFIKLLTPGQDLIRPTHTFALYLTALGKRFCKCVYWMSKFVRPKCMYRSSLMMKTHTNTWFTVVSTASVWNMSFHNNHPKFCQLFIYHRSLYGLLCSWEHKIQYTVVKQWDERQSGT